MLWSGSKPLTVVRENMWGFLLFAGVAWLAISWSVLRLDPTDIGDVAGPVILFGALIEAVRALAGTRTWWLNAGMAGLFAITAVLLLADGDSSYTTPAALIGWYLMVRGAADIAVSMMSRETDRIWGLLMVVGVLETALGFFAASSWSRTADLVVTVLGGLALARGIADLVASLRLREAVPVRADVLDLPPERAAGVEGYSAGLTDYAERPARTGPRHRAPSRSSGRTSSAAGLSALSARGGNRAEPDDAGSGLAAAGLTGNDQPEPARDTSFHDEVLRTTADLDAMLALAGVTGAGVGAGMAAHYDIPEVPDTAEGAELPADTAEMAVVRPDDEHREDAATTPDSTGRADQLAAPELDDTTIAAGGRLID
jgi:hypothetical protein